MSFTFNSSATGLGNNQFGGFGGFGQPQQKQPSTGGSLFGGFGQQQQQPSTGGSLFGGFGQQQQQQQPATGGSLFGGFGQQQQQQPSTGGSLFGGFGQQQQQPSTGGSLFGGFGQQQQQPATGGSLFGGFGQQQPSTGSSLFGGFDQQQQQPGGSIFGGFGQPQQQQQQQQQGGFPGKNQMQRESIYREISRIPRDTSMQERLELCKCIQLRLFPGSSTADELVAYLNQSFEVLVNPFVASESFSTAQSTLQQPMSFPGSAFYISAELQNVIRIITSRACIGVSPVLFLLSQVVKKLNENSTPEDVIHAALEQHVINTDLVLNTIRAVFSACAASNASERLQKTVRQFAKSLCEKGLFSTLLKHETLLEEYVRNTGGNCSVLLREMTLVSNTLVIMMCAFVPPNHVKFVCDIIKFYGVLLKLRKARQEEIDKDRTLADEFSAMESMKIGRINEANENGRTRPMLRTEIAYIEANLTSLMCLVFEMLHVDSSAEMTKDNESSALPETIITQDLLASVDKTIKEIGAEVSPTDKDLFSPFKLILGCVYVYTLQDDPSSEEGESNGKKKQDRQEWRKRIFIEAEGDSGSCWKGLFRLLGNVVPIYAHNINSIAMNEEEARINCEEIANRAVNMADSFVPDKTNSAQGRECSMDWKNKVTFADSAIPKVNEAGRKENEDNRNPLQRKINLTGIHADNDEAFIAKQGASSVFDETVRSVVFYFFRRTVPMYFLSINPDSLFVESKEGNRLCVLTSFLHFLTLVFHNVPRISAMFWDDSIPRFGQDYRSSNPDLPSAMDDPTFEDVQQQLPQCKLEFNKKVRVRLFRNAILNSKVLDSTRYFTKLLMGNCNSTIFAPICNFISTISYGDQCSSMAFNFLQLYGHTLSWNSLWTMLANAVTTFAAAPPPTPSKNKPMPALGFRSTLRDPRQQQQQKQDQETEWKNKLLACNCAAALRLIITILQCCPLADTDFADHQDISPLVTLFQLLVCRSASNEVHALSLDAINGFASSSELAETIWAKLEQIQFIPCSANRTLNATAGLPLEFETVERDLSQCNMTLAFFRLLRKLLLWTGAREICRMDYAQFLQPYFEFARDKVFLHISEREYNDPAQMYRLYSLFVSMCYDVIHGAKFRDADFSVSIAKASPAYQIMNDFVSQGPVLRAVLSFVSGVFKNPDYNAFTAPGEIATVIEDALCSSLALLDAAACIEEKFVRLHSTLSSGSDTKKNIQYTVKLGQSLLGFRGIPFTLAKLIGHSSDNNPRMSLLAAKLLQQASLNREEVLAGILSDPAVNGEVVSSFASSVFISDVSEPPATATESYANQDKIFVAKSLSGDRVQHEVLGFLIQNVGKPAPNITQAVLGYPLHKSLGVQNTFDNHIFHNTILDSVCKVLSACDNSNQDLYFMELCYQFLYAVLCSREMGHAVSEALHARARSGGFLLSLLPSLVLLLRSGNSAVSYGTCPGTDSKGALLEFMQKDTCILNSLSWYMKALALDTRRSAARLSRGHVAFVYEALFVSGRNNLSSASSNSQSTVSDDTSCTARELFNEIIKKYPMMDVAADTPVTRLFHLDELLKKCAFTSSSGVILTDLGLLQEYLQVEAMQILSSCAEDIKGSVESEGSVILSYARNSNTFRLFRNALESVLKSWSSMVDICCAQREITATISPSSSSSSCAIYCSVALDMLDLTLSFLRMDKSSSSSSIVASVASTAMSLSHRIFQEVEVCANTQNNSSFTALLDPSVSRIPQSLSYTVAALQALGFTASLASARSSLYIASLYLLRSLQLESPQPPQASLFLNPSSTVFAVLCNDALSTSTGQIREIAVSFLSYLLFLSPESAASLPLSFAARLARGPLDAHSLRILTSLASSPTGAARLAQQNIIPALINSVQPKSDIQTSVKADVAQDQLQISPEFLRMLAAASVHNALPASVSLSSILSRTSISNSFPAALLVAADNRCVSAKTLSAARESIPVALKQSSLKAESVQEVAGITRALLLVRPAADQHTLTNLLPLVIAARASVITSAAAAVASFPADSISFSSYAFKAAEPFFIAAADFARAAEIIIADLAVAAPRTQAADSSALASLWDIAQDLKNTSRFDSPLDIAQSFIDTLIELCNPQGTV